MERRVGGQRGAGGKVPGWVEYLARMRTGGLWLGVAASDEEMVYGRNLELGDGESQARPRMVYS